MFEQLQALPPDPLLGIIERFRQDSRAQKIDLGVGIYKDEAGETPVLASVKSAERHLLETQSSKRYLGAFGDARFTDAMLSLVLADYAERARHRIAALQTPGGCGALRVAAELIGSARPKARIWVSDPTWANHVPLLGSAGLDIATYPYYNHDKKSLRFDAMLACLEQASKGDLVLLHGCCHNPCGADLNRNQWQKVAEVCVARGLVPFVDMAYQGFGEGLEADAFGLRHMLATCPEAVFVVSCSKNFGLYRDRVGVVGFQLDSENAAKVVLSHAVSVVRGIYSMPPDHGAAVVAHILSQPSLREQWEGELGVMRRRIQAMREALANSMRVRLEDDRFAFVTRELGMFSFLGIRPKAVRQLAETYGIYMADSSRINVAGLTEANIDYFADALAAVISPSS